jgi:hypothetical protein
MTMRAYGEEEGEGEGGGHRESRIAAKYSVIRQYEGAGAYIWKDIA